MFLLIFSAIDRTMAGNNSMDFDKNNKSTCKNPTDIVALVDGKKILYSEISQKCSGEKTNCLIMVLKWKIQRVIYQEVCDKYDVKVTIFEVEKCWKEKFKMNVDLPQNEYKAVESVAIDEKLNKKIDQMIAYEDQDYARYLEIQKLPNPSKYQNEIWKIETDFSTAHGNVIIVQYQISQRYLWWKNIYEKASVQIFNKSLSGAWDKSKL